MANQPMIPGSQVVAYVMRETSFGTPRKPAGADALLPIDITLTPTQEREARDDRSSSSDYAESVEGRYSATWEITKYLMPSGTAGVSPDDHHLLNAGFGNSSGSATCCEYSLATAHTTSLTIRRGARANHADLSDFQDHVDGAIVNRIEFGWGSQGRNNLATVTYGGPAKEWGWTGNSTLNPDRPQNASHLTGNVTADTSLQFTKGSVFQIEKQAGVWDTAGGSGALITSINVTNHMLYFAETLNASHSGDDVIKPYNPTAITSGSPIHAKLGWLSLDGGTSQVRHLGGKITFEDNRELLADEYGQDSATEVLRKGKRNVTYTMDFYAKKTEMGDILGKARRGTNLHIQVLLGEQSGKRVRFRMKNCESNVMGVDLPDNDMGRYTLSGRAYGVNGNDSFRVQIV